MFPSILQAVVYEAEDATLNGAVVASNFRENGLSASKVTEYLLKGKILERRLWYAKRELGVRYEDIVGNSNLLGDANVDFK